MGFPPHPERRVAVITGASAGIGKATAWALATAGYPVALAARRGERCEEVAEKIRRTGAQAIGLALDVSDPDSVKSFAEEVRSEFGEPEIVVSNAGAIAMVSATDATSEQIEHDLNVNILGAHRLIREFAPGMIERQRGDLVFVSSDVVHTRRPGVAGYVAGKWGLEGMVSSLQMDLEGTGVRASIVRPGPTLTEIGAGWKRDEMMSMFDLWKRFGVYRHDGVLSPRDIADAVVSVVSAPRGTHVTLVEVQPEAPIKG